MAVIPSLDSILASVPEPFKYKLDQKLDHGHGDVPRDVGYIAKRIAEWEGEVADQLCLTRVEVRDIKYGPNRDHPELQRREALLKWMDKKDKFDKKATYRELITAFYRSGNLDYCTVVIKALQQDERVVCPAAPALTVRSVERALTNVTRWDDLGSYLGVSQCDIEEIKTKYHKEGVDGMKRQMIRKWLDTDSEASWEKLCHVLKANLHLPEQAEKIRSGFT